MDEVAVILNVVEILERDTSLEGFHQSRMERRNFDTWSEHRVPILEVDQNSELIH